MARNQAVQHVGSGNAEWLDVPLTPSTLTGAESMGSALRAAMAAGGVGRTERKPIPAGAVMADAACGRRGGGGGVALAGVDKVCLEQVRKAYAGTHNKYGPKKAVMVWLLSLADFA